MLDHGQDPADRDESVGWCDEYPSLCWTDEAVARAIYRVARGMGKPDPWAAAATMHVLGLIGQAGAAAACGIDQSAVSRRIATLRARLREQGYHEVAVRAAGWARDLTLTDYGRIIGPALDIDKLKTWYDRRADELDIRTDEDGPTVLVDRPTGKVPTLRFTARRIVDATDYLDKAVGDHLSQGGTCLRRKTATGEVADCFRGATRVARYVARAVGEHRLVNAAVAESKAATRRADIQDAAPAGIAGIGPHDVDPY